MSCPDLKKGPSEVQGLSLSMPWRKRPEPKLLSHDFYSPPLPQGIVRSRDAHEPQDRDRHRHPPWQGCGSQEGQPGPCPCSRSSRGSSPSRSRISSSIWEIGYRTKIQRPICGWRRRSVRPCIEPIGRWPRFFHVCGNHDRDFLSVYQNERVLGQSLDNITLDLGAWRIALFRADTFIRRPGGFCCPETDIAWLERTIDDADRAAADRQPCAGVRT